jgi:hypothetical protein
MSYDHCRPKAASAEEMREPSGRLVEVADSSAAISNNSFLECLRATR